MSLAIKLLTLDINWQKCLGGSGADAVYSIQQTLNGGYIVAGLTRFTDGDVSGYIGGNSDAWVVKFGLTIITTSLPNGAVGTPYSETLTATGGPGAITWMLDDGSLPSGLILLENGTISGTPTLDGTADFTVRAASGTESISIAIASAGDSGGGCDSGFFSAASALLVLFSLLAVRKK
jgi:hypothetical protein